MGTKDLKDKAIDIKGKQYVMVSDRILYFNEAYQYGMIVTELLSLPADQMVVVKAVVTPDTNKPDRKFTGHSQAKWGDGYINKTSAMENAETSAVGRALALMGIGVLDSIASVDEITKAQNMEKAQAKPNGTYKPATPTKTYSPAIITEYQQTKIHGLLKSKGKTIDDLAHFVDQAFKIEDWQKMTIAQANMIIKKLEGLPSADIPQLEDVDVDEVMDALDKLEPQDSPEGKNV